MTDQDDSNRNDFDGEFNISTEMIRPGRVRFLAIELRNFLSFKKATLSFSDFNALVGPNASGKSNAVSAIRLLREIPSYGLPLAIARRGGFDQLRHRSHGHPNDPSLKLTFEIEGSSRPSHYSLSLGAVKGGQYRVKKESGRVFYADGGMSGFDRGEEKLESYVEHPKWARKQFSFGTSSLAGQTALPAAIVAGTTISAVLQRMQTVEVNPAKVADLQEPSSTEIFESDGSNVASIFESFDKKTRQEVAERLAAIVPGIVSIEIARLADKLTLRFKQSSSDKGPAREFLAKQMSDGTLRAFSILVALLQDGQSGLLVIEEPEIAIHLGALSTLVQLLRSETEQTQILITTHSADIVDALPLESLRVVWYENGASNIAELAEHTKIPVRKGLITPGQLLRSDALDPQIA
ncbi:AAA family ATPase [Mycolicibacterium peregrinum]|uniref:AAA family ATPase n=1 Tax=Mycolicibacterium peregrinum TaxID=43304 RepID=UPI0009EDA86C|nr:AAA family ATPase [Mycolicibacterium peregrinum]